MRGGRLVGMKRKRSAFTLLELLMVLGVMGLLMSVLLPAVGVVREKAQRMATGQKVRQLALGVAGFHTVTGRPLTAANLGGWMSRLAEATGIREGGLYIYPEDPLLAAIAEEAPPALIERGEDMNWGPIEGFANWPVGVAVASGVAPGASPSTTPVVWTRGLTGEGTWQGGAGQRAGIYGTEGGYVGFLDGHVEFYRDLGANGGQLLDYATGQRTGDIREALPPGARVYDHAGRVF